MTSRLVRPPYLFSILSPLILLSPLLLTGKAMFWGTPITQFIPWWSYAWERIGEGSLPLWNPYLGMGAPLIANYQSAIFYPPNWVYFLLDSVGGTPWMAWGQALLVAFHLIIACIGMFFLARKLGVGEFGQTISALSFGLSGYLVSRAGFLSINSAVAWLPWIILAVTDIYEQVREENKNTRNDPVQDRFSTLSGRKWFGSFLLLGLCTGLLLLAGHAQISWYIFIFLALWLLYLSLRDRREGWFRTTWLVVGVAITLGSILAAIQLFPTGEYLVESQRANSVDYAGAMSYSFWPWHFLTFLAPGLFGSPVSGDYWGYANFWEDAVYIGLAPFLLATGAIVANLKSLPGNGSPWRKLVIFLVIVIGTSFVIALGRFTPVFPWLFRSVPTFNLFQGPSRISLLAILALSLLAGMGTRIWRRPLGKGLYWSRLGTAGAAAVAVGAGIASITANASVVNIEPTFIRSTALVGFWGVGFGLLTLTAPESDQPHQNGFVWSSWHWVACLWVAVDLIFAGWGLIPGVDRELYGTQPLSTTSIRKLVGDGRLFLPAESEEEIKFSRFFRFDTFTPFSEGGEAWEELRVSLLPNLTLLDRIPSANNFDPILPARFALWSSELNGAGGKIQDELLNLMSVTVVEVTDPASQAGVKFMKREAYPRIRWVPCSRIAKDGSIALELVLGGDIDFSREVVIEGESSSVNPCEADHSPHVITHVDQPDTLRVEVLADIPGYLVVSDVWYPGWEANLDGETTVLSRANYLFRGVYVPAGDHEIEITYHPTWFNRGVYTSGSGLIVWISLALLWKRNRK